LFCFLGLVDPLPLSSTLTILKTYLPPILFNKLQKYVTSPPDNVNCSVDWSYFESSLKRCNLQTCAEELLVMLENSSVQEKNVQTFHINQNFKQNKCTEPNHSNTTQMIQKFLITIYQRNIITSLVKYILLQDIIVRLENSNLISPKKGIFFSMFTRLKEIIFESVLIAFNGSRYDNFLLCNYLIDIQCQYKNKIKIFKKGGALSTIILQWRKNFNTNKSKIKLKKKNIWPMNLYIKDLRDLVSANMSLDKIGHLFSLNVSKLCFPYEKAISIKKLKTISSLKIHDEIFWTDTFTGKKVSIEQRRLAQNVFTQKKFHNLYEFSTYYLVIDCLLLHSVLLKIFNSYLQDSINIFIRRKYSQSSLSFQQFFIMDPAKQIDHILAPVKLNNPFLNYFMKQAVTGGLCTSFVHGVIDSTTPINDQFNYISDPQLNPSVWPNFNNLKPWTKCFNEKPSGIITFDIRSLYPSAAVKKIPVGIPLIYSRFINKDIHHLKDKNTTFNLNINSFCSSVQNNNDCQQDYFKLINEPAKFNHEFNVIQFYLNSLPKNIEILRFQSNFTAMGQLYFGQYPLDGFLSFLYQNKIFIKLIQYQSVYYHGHASSCSISNSETNITKANKTLEIKKNIEQLYSNFFQIFHEHFLHPLEFEYVEIFECDFPQHKIPPTISNQLFYKKEYHYQSFLTNICNKNLTGFLVVKNLEIKKNNQNPIFGFIIQKVEYELKNLSDYTQKLIEHYIPTRRVVSLHQSKSYMIISTEYFNWLHKTFGFEKTPDIYHAILFQLQPYLRHSIESKLFLRKQIKQFISVEKDPVKKQNYEIKAELIKLMLNSCYGFTMCNLGSSKFKSFENRTKKPEKNNTNIISCIKLKEKTYLIEKKNKQDIFETLLGHVGCSILFHSKIILLKRLYFLLKYLNPTKAQLLYMDTDSAHFLVKHKKIDENVDFNLRPEFLSLMNKHFENGPKISGIWVTEGFFNHGEYFGEKCYKLYESNHQKYLTHIKGLNNFFQQKMQEENVDLNKHFYISYNSFVKTSDFLIFKTHMNKNLRSFFIPMKRYFVCSHGSLPLKIT